MKTLVKTSFGSIRGMELESAFVFNGIPFAKAPVGKNRFRKPDQSDSWQGVREATAFSDAAMQSEKATPVGEIIGYPAAVCSEDCHYLNIWTPKNAVEKCPVMVWIHGGGNTTGSAVPVPV